jgi:hypothetical protein
MSSIGEELPIVSEDAHQDPPVDNYKMMSLPLTILHEDGQLVEPLRWHLAPFSIPARVADSFAITFAQTSDERPDATPYLSYIRGGDVLFRGTPFAVLAHALWDIHSIVHQESHDYLFIHAGVVAWNDRRVVLPAEPDAGKSTLVASLMRLGFGYLSDELAPIDPVTSAIYPFPKHVSVANHGLEHIAGGEPSLPDDYPELTLELADRFLRPQDLSSHYAAHGPADLIFFLSADRGGSPEVRELSSAETLAALLGHTLNAERYGERGVKLLALVTAAAKSFELRGGSSADRADLIRSIVVDA